MLILVKIGDFGQKSAGFIRVCGCWVLSEIEGGGSANVRLDFSDFGDWWLFWDLGVSYIWFSSDWRCPDLKFWGCQLNPTVSGFQNERLGCENDDYTGGCLREEVLKSRYLENRSECGDTWRLSRSLSIDRLGWGCVKMSGLSAIWVSGEVV